MPCYSTVQTQLIDLPAIDRAAAALGLKVERKSVNEVKLTSRDGSASLTLIRNRPADKFSFSSYAATGDYDGQIVRPLIQGYAKEQLKVFARKNGYTLAPGKKPGQYELVSLKG